MRKPIREKRLAAEVFVPWLIFLSLFSLGTAAVSSQLQSWGQSLVAPVIAATCALANPLRVL